MDKIVYPEHKIRNYGHLTLMCIITFGTNYQEKYYQKAIEIELKQHELKYEKEKLGHLHYKDEYIGRYFIDFIIESKIVR